MPDINLTPGLELVNFMGDCLTIVRKEEYVLCSSGLCAVKSKNTMIWNHLSG